MALREDWVTIKLTAAGERLANGAPVRVIHGSHSFEIHPGKTLEVTRAFDWEMVLKHETCAGEPLLEIIEAEPKAKVKSKGD